MNVYLGCVLAGCAPAIVYILTQIHARLADIAGALGAYDEQPDDPADGG